MRLMSECVWRVDDGVLAPRCERRSLSQVKRRRTKRYPYRNTRGGCVQRAANPTHRHTQLAVGSAVALVAYRPALPANGIVRPVLPLQLVSPSNPKAALARCLTNAVMAIVGPAYGDKRAAARHAHATTCRQRSCAPFPTERSGPQRCEYPRPDSERNDTRGCANARPIYLAGLRGALRSGYPQ